MGWLLGPVGRAGKPWAGRVVGTQLPFVRRVRCFRAQVRFASGARCVLIYIGCPSWALFERAPVCICRGFGLDGHTRLWPRCYDGRVSSNSFRGGRQSVPLRRRHRRRLALCAFVVPYLALCFSLPLASCPCLAASKAAGVRCVFLIFIVCVCHHDTTGSTAARLHGADTLGLARTAGAKKTSTNNWRTGTGATATAAFRPTSGTASRPTGHCCPSRITTASAAPNRCRSNSCI